MTKTPHTHIASTCLALLIGFGVVACDDPKRTNVATIDTCGAGESFEVEGELYCLYRVAIIEEGFMCPAELMHRHDFDGFSVCSGAGGDLPEGVEEELRERAGFAPLSNNAMDNNAMDNNAMRCPDDTEPVGGECVPIENCGEEGDADLDGFCDDVDTCAGDDTSGDTDGDGVCDDTDACVGDDATGDSDLDGTCDDLDPRLGPCGAVALDSAENLGEDGTYRDRVGFSVGNDHDAVCNTETWHNGNDGIFSFSAPFAGRWLFWSRGQQLWSFTGRATCDDDASELEGACGKLNAFHGDDPFGEARGFRLDLQAGETVFLVLDGCPAAGGPCTAELAAVPPLADGAGCAPFRPFGWERDPSPANSCDVGSFCSDLVGETQTCQPSTAPAISSVVARTIGDGALRIVIEGVDESLDTRSALLELLDAGGEPLPLVEGSEELVSRYYFENRAEVEADGSAFTGLIFTGVNTPLALESATRARLTLIDSQELLSDPVEVDITMDIPRQGEDATCDRHEVLNLCEEALICLQVEEEDADKTCVTPAPPTITSATAYVNADLGRLGVIIEGTDTNNDVSAYSVTVYDSADTAHLIADAYRFSSNRLTVGQGSFAADFPLTFDTDTIDVITGVEFVVHDGAGLTSPSFESTVGPTPVVDRDEACDPQFTFSVCGGGDLCDLMNTETFRCVEPIAACPADWEVIDLNANGDQANGWSVSGRLNDADATTSACEGGNLNDEVFSFTAQEAGIYRFEAISVADGFSEFPSPPTLEIRTLCGLTWAPEARLSCSANPVFEEPPSTFAEHALEADETVYIVYQDALEVYDHLSMMNITRTIDYTVSVMVVE